MEGADARRAWRAFWVDVAILGPAFTLLIFAFFMDLAPPPVHAECRGELRNTESALNPLALVGAGLTWWRIVKSRSPGRAARTGGALVAALLLVGCLSVDAADAIAFGALISGGLALVVLTIAVFGAIGSLFSARSRPDSRDVVWGRRAHLVGLWVTFLYGSLAVGLFESTVGSGFVCGS